MSRAAGAAAEVVVRGAGGLLALAGGLAGGLLAVLLVPLRVIDAAELVGLAGLAGTGVGATRVPVALVVAAGGNLLLVRYAEWATGVRWGTLLPALGWFLAVWAAVRITAEGDRLLMPDDVVGVLTLFTGTVVLVIAVVLALTSGTPGRVR